MTANNMADGVNHWTDSEIMLLKEIYPHYSNIELEKILGHPKNSVSAKAIELGLRKSFWWTEDDVVTLQDYYPEMGAYKFQQAFMPNKSVGAIRKKAHTLNIKLNKDVALRIRNENLKGRLTATLAEHPDFKGCRDLRASARNRLSGWRKDVLSHYGHRCAITGIKDNVVVHHINPFSDIFYNTLRLYEQKYGFVRKDRMQDCINRNGNELVESFLSAVSNNHKIGHGVVLEAKIHDLFHTIYGTYYFTRDDYWEFVDRYNSGDFKEGVVTS